MSTSKSKGVFARFEADIPKSPMKSREQRLIESMPPVVVEMLERRGLMALTTSLALGTLEIDGTTGGDVISVYIGASPDTLIHINDGLGGSYPGYAPNQVSLIKILAGGGNDSVYINRSGASAVSELCLIYGEAGTDYIEGGNLTDSIFGGDGADPLYGYGGTESIYGGAGDDRVYGGDDGDMIRGEGGDDSLLGQDQDDLVYGGDGYDTLDGGTGDDSLYGDADNDSITGNAGQDLLLGGTGDDTLIARDQETDTLDGGACTGCESIA